MPKAIYYLLKGDYDLSKAKLLGREGLTRDVGHVHELR